MVENSITLDYFLLFLFGATGIGYIGMWGWAVLECMTEIKKTSILLKNNLNPASPTQATSPTQLTPLIPPIPTKLSVRYILKTHLRSLRGYDMILGVVIFTIVTVILLYRMSKVYFRSVAYISQTAINYNQPVLEDLFETFANISLVTLGGVVVVNIVLIMVGIIVVTYPILRDVFGYIAGNIHNRLKIFHSKGDKI